VTGFDIGGAAFLEANPKWIQDADPDLFMSDDANRIILNPQNSSAMRYVRFHIPLVEIERHGSELDGLSEIEVNVATRLAGLEDIQLTRAQSGYPPPILPPG
jgi:hypothetical protein